jgi:mannose-6-phosphate isomerase-like protein (cupin superfamily)
MIRSSGMQVFSFADLASRLEKLGTRYWEFLRESTMSAGIYGLPVDGTDPQGPHHEDELYVVIEGSAVVQVAGESKPVSRGSTIFVPAGATHRFHGITDDLRVLVVFAPPETTPSPE